MILSEIKKIISRLIDYRRERFKYRKRLRNKNKTPTIISNNCIGGIIYHDLGLEFMSPTINLFFKNEDFFTFLNDIEYYINQVPYEVFEEGLNFSYGRDSERRRVCKTLFYAL